MERALLPFVLLAVAACSPTPPSNPDGSSCGMDMTPPTLSISGPSCLWPPGHKMGLYALGDGIDVHVQDDCDPNPVIQVVSVSSNQPDLGGGQGNFAPDIIHGTKAVCFRAEREGSVATDREYTIVVTATDASNNVATQTLVVRVPHDGTCAGQPTPTMVDDTDPRCTAN